MNQPASRPTPATLSLESALRERRSVRGYLPDPVPDAVLREVFELAQTAPSNCNVQPWQVYVASGATRDELRRRFTEGVASGKAMTPDIGFLPALAGTHRTRQVECAQARFDRPRGHQAFNTTANPGRRGSGWVGMVLHHVRNSPGPCACAHLSWCRWPLHGHDRSLGR